MRPRSKGWTQMAGAVVTGLTILGFGWKVAEGWFALQARVGLLEREQRYLHGAVDVPGMERGR